MTTLASLHTHSWYSLLEGVSAPDALLARAAACGYAAVALTDSNNLYGAAAFVEAAKGRGVRPLLGACLRQHRTRCVALVAEPAGWRGLCRVLSRLHLLGDVLLADLLRENAEGLHVLADDLPLAERLRDAFGGRLWLEVVRPGRGDRPRRENERREAELLEGGRRMGLRPSPAPPPTSPRPRSTPPSARRRPCAAGRCSTGCPARCPSRRTITSWTGRRGGGGSATCPRRCTTSPASPNNFRPTCFRERRCCPRRGSPAGWSGSGSCGCCATAACAAAAFTATPRPTRGSARSWSSSRPPTWPRTSSSSATSPATPAAGACRRPCAVRRETRWSATCWRSPTWTRSASAWRWTASCTSAGRTCPTSTWISTGGCATRSSPTPSAATATRTRRWSARTCSSGRAPPSARRGRSTGCRTSKSRGWRATRAGRRTNGTTGRVRRVLADAPPPPGFPLEPSRWPRLLGDARRLLGRPHHLSVHCGGVVITPRPIDEYVPLQRAAKGVVVTQFDKDGVEAAGLVKIDLLGNRALANVEETLRLAGGASRPAPLLRRPGRAAPSPDRRHARRQPAGVAGHAPPAHPDATAGDRGRGLRPGADPARRGRGRHEGAVHPPAPRGRARADAARLPRSGAARHLRPARLPGRRPRHDPRPDGPVGPRVAPLLQAAPPRK